MSSKTSAERKTNCDSVESLPRSTSEVKKRKLVFPYESEFENNEKKFVPGPFSGPEFQTRTVISE